LNNTIGHICFAAYAWLDYRSTYEKHWRHHNHTGIVHDDPDYHNGRSIGFFSWYFQFMCEYITVKQLSKMSVWVTILLLICSVPLLNIILFMLICGLCSSLRLFYFGTYLPHRPMIINEKMPWEKSKSSNVSRWISFLCCYHFDYHWEHHRWPYAPWWDLWKCKEMRQLNSSD
jgi:beta-carotene ketolase (CrtW type)